MRIISGDKRGRKLLALDGDSVRPTSDRVKEALFNILQFQLAGRRFLDLFAGSGQIGLEALSRGAQSAVFVDASRRSVAVIEKNLAMAELQDRAKVYAADAVALITGLDSGFDVAFLDPPYHSELLEEVLPLVAGKMSQGGIIVCEHPLEVSLPESAGDFQKAKEYRYGKILLTTYLHNAVAERIKGL